MALSNKLKLMACSLCCGDGTSSSFECFVSLGNENSLEMTSWRNGCSENVLILLKWHCKLLLLGNIGFPTTLSGGGRFCYHNLCAGRRRIPVTIENCRKKRKFILWKFEEIGSHEQQCFVSG